MKKTSILILTIAALALCFSCRNASERTAERQIEKAIGDNADVKIDDDKITIKTDEGILVTDTGDKKWPGEIPSDVPEFTYGKVERVSIQDMPEAKNWVMRFSGVKEDALTKYEADLKAKGFDAHTTRIMNGRGNVMGEKGNLIVAAMAGDGEATLTVSREKE